MDEPVAKAVHARLARAGRDLRVMPRARGCDTAPLLSARDRADDQKGLVAGRHRFRQRRVGRLVREVTPAGEKPDERAAFLGDVIANRTAEHRVVRLDRVHDRPLRDSPHNVDPDFGGDLGQSKLYAK